MPEHPAPDKGSSGSAPVTPAESPCRLGYLVSRYPALSHTFILREVRWLRANGFEIHTASVNRPDRPIPALTAEEREEAAGTFFLKQAGVGGAARAHVLALLTHPWRYLRGLGFALALGWPDLKRLRLCFFYFIEAVMVGRWMTDRGLRHLHVHFATPASTVGLICSRIYACGLSVTIHGPDEFYDAPGYLLAEKIRGADFLCCISHFARSQMMKLSPASEWDKFELAPLGVDPAAFSPRPFRAAPRPFELLCVGRLVPAKGQQLLLRAVAALVGQGRQVRLCLVGDGPDRAALERSAAETGLAEVVVFAGAVDQDRIRGFYTEADAFVLASFAEGVPVVLMEAMAMEIPCVTTRITGVPELIRDGIDGLLVPASDTEGLVEAIARLMDEPELRRSLGENGRRRVIERYNLETNTRRLGRIFRQRLAGKG